MTSAVQTNRDTNEQSQRYRAVERRYWEHYGAVPTARFLDLARPRVRVRVLEVGEGPTVLFVHGGPNAGSTWAPLAAQLPGFRCVVLDRPGCGLSEPVDYANLDLRTLAVDVLTSVLDALEIEQTAVVASSFGGAWAFWLAAAQSQRVTHLVQEACPAFIRGMKLPLMLRLLAMPAAARFIAHQKSTPKTAESVFRQLGHGASLAAGRFPGVWYDWSQSLMNDTDTMRNEVRAIQRAATWRGVQPGLTYGAELLRQVTQPTLVLWGADDPFGGVELGHQACAALPNATLRVFPAAGHLPWLDDPSAHVQEVRAFLRADRPEEVVVASSRIFPKAAAVA